MEQFLHLGEACGSLRAIMVFHDHIRINRGQCEFLFEVFLQAFDVVATEIKENLRFDEKQGKWTALEHPLRELVGIFRGGERYVRQCLETSRGCWWAKAVLLRHNNDVVEDHLHRLLWCIPVVLEAMEAAVEEVPGCEQEEARRRRIIVSKKYEKDWLDPKLFESKFGKQYLVSPEMVGRMEAVWKEDRWVLMEMMSEKAYPTTDDSSAKHRQRLAELLAAPPHRLFPTSVLVGSKDYQVKRRLGNGSHYKEIQWMGEGFALRHFFGDIEPLVPEIKLLSSLSHPNVVHVLCAFSDEERKECFLLMELMNRDLCNHIKEITSPKRKVPFPLPVAVDVMLQIARGMEYIYSRNVPHGNLNPSNVLVKTTDDNRLRVKVTGVGLLSLLKLSSSHKTSVGQCCIWRAPEVLQGDDDPARFNEKADVYSFAMICFQLLTGKVPFDDMHLQGEKTSRNIRAGERPLFPFPSPKYLTNLTKRCWHPDPSQRPTFSSLCRILRYVKRFLLLSPDHCRPDAPAPVVDYHDLESSLCRRSPSWARKEQLRVTQVPFQMFAYRVIERERTCLNYRDRGSDSGSDDASACGDENGYAIGLITDDCRLTLPSRSPPKANYGINRKMQTKKVVNGKAAKEAGFQQKKGRATVSAADKMACVHNLRARPESRLPPLASSRLRRKPSGHASDSELAYEKE